VYDDVQGLGPEPQYDKVHEITVPGPVDGDAPSIAQQQIQITESIPAISIPTRRQYLPA
jgi:hypothetical protein